MRSTLQLLRGRGPRNVTSVPMATRFGFGALVAGGANNAAAQMAAYGQVGTLFSIVHRLGEATSQVGWQLWRKPADGQQRYEGEETRQLVTRHAVRDLWENPNPWQSGMEFREASQQHLDLTGEAWWLVVRSPMADLPLELWSIRPDRMVPVPHPTKFITGYVYSGPGGEQVPLGLQDVIQIKLPHPTDPYRGLGPVQAVLTDLDAARYSAEWNRNFFVNSAEPGGIIEFPEPLEDDEFRTFAERWREQHQGVSAAHRVAILERGQWKDRVINQRDMQFVELRKLAREVIREAFGIHGHMLGTSEDVNKANAEAGAASFGKWLVRPRLARFKAAANRRLLPMFGTTTRGLELDHEDPEPPDRQSDDRERTSKASAFATLVGAGVEPDAAAAVCGWPTLKMAEPEAEEEPAAVEPDGSGPATPRELAEMVQKIYLGVGPVLSQNEARGVLDRAGAGLGPAAEVVEEEPVTPPEEEPAGLVEEPVEEPVEGPAEEPAE